MISEVAHESNEVEECLLIFRQWKIKYFFALGRSELCPFARNEMSNILYLLET